MPAIERLAVEEQLGTLHRAKPVPAKPALPPPKYADLSMSWEEVEPVNRALAAPASKPFVLGRPATRGPRFSGTTALPAFTNADDSFTVAGRGLFTSAAIPTATAAKGPRASLQMPLIDSAALNRKATAAPSAGPQLSNGLSSSVNGNGGLFAAQSGGSRNNLFGSTSTLTTTHVKPAHSLFLQASPNGSAVLPPPTNDGPRASASPPMDGFVEDEDEFGLADGGDEEDDEQPLPKRAPSSSPVEFSHSVFMNNGHAAVVKAAPQTLPGAFHADDDDLDLEAAAHTPPSPSTFPPPAKSRRTHGTSARRLPSPSPPPPPASRAKTRTRAQTKPVRVPGGFFDGEPEQEDEVPPLPDVSPVKRMVRKNRATASSRASSAEVEDRDDGVRVRRSARLSVASSSPEPVSVSPPKKPARKTRASTGAGKAVARRKR
ncbi:hypothetical protein FA95DRAFT_50523 [Auriscalpium vulgare]|uniref:Uncharacterized protein n=1 Tax=Auriscalpium vulgare TaxID=40419 RepID=A0ACB8S677_9AGAM|nr:hypothetical protein FA95DRAFT_50523 [Auriscalpium vulgare]